LKRTGILVKSIMALGIQLVRLRDKLASIDHDLATKVVSVLPFVQGFEQEARWAKQDAERLREDIKYWQKLADTRSEEANKYYTELQETKRKLDVAKAPPPVESEKTAWESGKRIQAIKDYKDRTGLELLSAKKVLEETFGYAV
jgi:ribosomal protein L7/L12